MSYVLLKQQILLALLIVFVISFNKVEAGYPFGGTCEVISPNKAMAIASKVVSGFRLKFNRGQSACKHNVELIETNGEKILKISTRLGDGIHTHRGERNINGWSDIRAGNRRRFEFYTHTLINRDTAFRIEYSVRITQDNTFLHIPEHQYYWYWITQLHPGCNNCSPTMVVSVDRFNGISAFDYLIQDSSEFGAVKTEYTPEIVGKWVKIAIEFKPSHKNGFRRLWVNDQLVVNENNVQTIFGRSSNTFNLKFGIYQGTAKGDKNADYPSIRQDNQQSIQFKNFKFKRI